MSQKEELEGRLDPSTGEAAGVSPAPEGVSQADLQAALIEQEHRIFQVLYNYFYRAKVENWSRTDRRSLAAFRALLWRVISPATVAATGAGVLGIATLLIGGLTYRELVRQNLLFQDQVTKQQNANELVQEQVKLQRSSSYAVQRAQLIATIYDRTDCASMAREDHKPESKPPSLQCPFRSSVRARAEAAVAFVALERAEGVRQPDLSHINLDGASLMDVDLSNVSFFAASFVDASLWNVDMSDCVLGDARFDDAVLVATFDGSAMTGASLRNVWSSSAFRRVDLRCADFTGANLLGNVFCDADLRAVTMEGADLTNSDLSGALMRESKHALLPALLFNPCNRMPQVAPPRVMVCDEDAFLEMATLDMVCYDDYTIWPEQVEPRERDCDSSGSFESEDDDRGSIVPFIQSRGLLGRIATAPRLVKSVPPERTAIGNREQCTLDGVE